MGTRLPLLTCGIFTEKKKKKSFNFHFLNVIAISWRLSILHVNDSAQVNPLLQINSLIYSSTFYAPDISGIAQKSKLIKGKSKKAYDDD